MDIRYHHDTRMKDQRGFSLIDVAVVMAIVGVLLAGFLATYKMYQATRASTVTEENFMAAQEALGAFIANWNNKYPTPAAFGLTTGDAEYGEGADASSAVSCTTASNAKGKICKANGVTDADGTHEVLIGVLPFADMGLPEAQARDGYGRLFTYAVSTELTVDGGADPIYTYTKDTDGDHVNDAEPSSIKYNHYICVKTQDLNDDGDMLTGDCTAAAGNPPRAMVLVSHGADGIGAWLPTGKQYAPCGTVGGSYPSTSQNENCNFDGTFIQAMRLIHDDNDTPDPADDVDLRQPMQVRGDNVNKNDDLIQVEVREDGNYWGAGDMISNKYNYNVGIGVADPKESLDVAGNIKVPQVLAKKLCEDGDDPASDQGCLNVESLAGSMDEMNCGMGMVKGFENNKAVCIYPAEPKTCLETEYISGVDPSGNIVCTPLPATCGSAHDAYGAPAEADKCANGTPGATSGTGPWAWTCTLGGKTVNCSSKAGEKPKEGDPPPVTCQDECHEERSPGQTWCNRGYPAGRRKCESDGNVSSQGCISGIGCCSGGTLQCN